MKKRKSTDISSTNAFPTSMKEFKISPYILESMLTSYDMLHPEAVPCGLFGGQDPVYRRTDVFELKSAQSWKSKYSRGIQEHQRPLRVVSRDVGGVSRTIELFSLEQTEPLATLVASIEAGIPANEYGNVEIDRIPENSVLLRVDDIDLAVRVCRQIQVVHRKCQSGWKRKRPLFAGVVVLREDEDRAQAAIDSEVSRKLDKEKEHRDQAALAVWRILLRRIKAEYYIQNIMDGPEVVI